MNAPAINRKQRRQAQIKIPEPKQDSEPKQREYSAPACSCCTEVRPKGTNYSRVYGKVVTSKQIIRYVRCDFCRHTWKDISPVFNDN